MAVITTKCLFSSGQNVMLIQYVVRVYPHGIKTAWFVYSFAGTMEGYRQVA